MNSLVIDRSFVEQINAHDVNALTALRQAIGVRWETPIACCAQVRDGQIAEWRVYADNEPLRQLMKG